MDEEGWIPLSVISNFNRIKFLTTDTNTILETIKGSTILECNDEKIRRKDDWKTWVIPKVTPAIVLPINIFFVEPVKRQTFSFKILYRKLNNKKIQRLKKTFNLYKNSEI